MGVDQNIKKLVSHSHLTENYKIDQQHEYNDLYTRKKTFLEKSQSQGVKGYIAKHINQNINSNIKEQVADADESTVGEFKKKMKD